MSSAVVVMFHCHGASERERDDLLVSGGAHTGLSFFKTVLGATTCSSVVAQSSVVAVTYHCHGELR